MPWEKFKVKSRGTSKLLNMTTNEIVDCSYERGTVSTGKSDVFGGYYIKINTDDFEVTAHDPSYSETYTVALKECNEKLKRLGFLLLAAGNSADYSESAMSGGAGYGYSREMGGTVDILEHVAQARQGTL